MWILYFSVTYPRIGDADPATCTRALSYPRAALDTSSIRTTIKISWIHILNETIVNLRTSSNGMRGQRVREYNFHHLLLANILFPRMLRLTPRRDFPPTPTKERVRAL